MVAGGIASAAHIADHLALHYLLALRHTDCGTVCIQRVKGAVVADLDVVPIAAAPRVGAVGDGHGAPCRGQYGRTVRRGDVRAAVVAHFPGKRVAAVPKP